MPSSIKRIVKIFYKLSETRVLITPENLRNNFMEVVTSLRMDRIWKSILDLGKI